MIEAGGFKIDRNQVQISQAIKAIGLFTMPVVLHPEVRVNVTVNVARSEDEAERQARGENVLAERTEQEEAKVAAEELFEEGAAPEAGRRPRKNPPKPDHLRLRKTKKPGLDRPGFFFQAAPISRQRFSQRIHQHVGPCSREPASS